MRLRLHFWLAVLVVACAGLLSACGSGDEGDTVDTGGDGLTVTADGDGALEWAPTELTAPAGSVTVTLDNPAPVAHDIAIEGNGVDEKSDIVTEGTVSVTAELEPGDYTFYCTVPGHEESGMTGALTVE